jgi:peptidoglycan/LPS O-acetylase OafA/YrhL
MESSHLTPFSINSPGWSIFFEIIVNVAYAGIARFLTPRSLIPIIALSLFWLAYATVSAGSVGSLGGYYATLPSGLPRTAFSFFLGVLIFILSKTAVLPTIKFPAVGLAIALLLIFAPNFSAVPNVYYDLVCVRARFPRDNRSRIPKQAVEKRRGPCCPGRRTFLPDLFVTLSVYRLVRGTAAAAAKLHLCGNPGGALLSYLALKYYDEPVRAWLRDRLTPKRKVSAVKTMAE